MFEYYTSGTCSKKITFTIKDNRIWDLHFTSGCEGNLKAISKLVDGQPVDEIIRKLKGVECGSKGTSCADQLALALTAAAAKMGAEPAAVGRFGSESLN